MWDFFYMFPISIILALKKGYDSQNDDIKNYDFRKSGGRDTLTIMQ